MSNGMDEFRGRQMLIPNTNIWKRYELLASGDRDAPVDDDGLAGDEAARIRGKPHQRGS